MYTEVVGGDNDDSVEAAPAGSVNIAVLTSVRLDKLAAMHAAAACAIQKQNTCPHRNFVTSGLPMQNRIQNPGGQPTGFEDPCRTVGLTRASCDEYVYCENARSLGCPRI